MDLPETRYAQSTRGRIAYQTIGDGPVDVVVAHGLAVPIDLMWDEPAVVRFFDRLSSFCRLICFDPRGRGSSDPAAHNEQNVLEGMAEDITAVIDVIGCDQVAVLAQVGPPALLFAASHPERVAALVLLNTNGARGIHLIATPSPTGTLSDDYPDGLPSAVAEQMLEEYRRSWGTGSVLRVIAPSVAGDERFRTWWGRCERLTSSAEDQYWRVSTGWEIDVRSVLATISAPTLVLSRNGTGPAAARYVAEHIERAKYVELDGDDAVFFVGDTGLMLEEIETFLTGRRPPVEGNRVLATILFTDIVGSTERASTLGDRAWRELLDRFRATVRENLQRYRGREINTRGDDFLATFDGPARAINCARAITSAALALEVEVRTGIHTGEVELMGDDVAGIAVHIGARVCALAGAGDVLVTSVVRDLVAGSGIDFAEHSRQPLKGVSGEWTILCVA